VKDVMAIENTAQYNGVYHVLGGVISPINGIGPSDLKIESLVNKLNHGQSEIKEVILALSPTMEGDTTAFYINKRIKELTIKVSVIARGIPIGGDLEYADEITLGRSIIGRTLFN
jgi:recombination protein RecR